MSSPPEMILQVLSIVLVDIRVPLATEFVSYSTCSTEKSLIDAVYELASFAVLFNTCHNSQELATFYCNSLCIRLCPCAIALCQLLLELFAAIPECGGNVLTQGHEVRVQNSSPAVPSPAAASRAPQSHH